MSAYKQRALQLFDLLDTDRSGYIDPADIARRVEGQSETQAEAAQIVHGLVMGFIRSGDANKNGAVSKDELLAHMEKAMVGKSPDTTPGYLREFTSAVFTLMDADKSGKVSKAEFEQYLTAHNVTAPGAVNEFAQLDRDRDGSITSDDLHIAAYNFFTAPDPGYPEHWLGAVVSV